MAVIQMAVVAQMVGYCPRRKQRWLALLKICDSMDWACFFLTILEKTAVFGLGSWRRFVQQRHALMTRPAHAKK